MTSAVPHLRTSTPACPRCGYDLSGQVASWGGRALQSGAEPRRHGGHEEEAREFADGAACPLRGTCSECGLEFEWRLVMRPELAALRWFVESPVPPRRKWSALRTCLRLAYPPGFWREVTLEAKVEPRRLAAWVGFVGATAALVPGLTCVLAVVWTITTWLHWLRIGTPARGSLQTWQVFVGNASSALFSQLEAARAPPVWLSASTSVSVVFSVVFCCLPHTRAKAKVQTWLVVRTTLYGLGWLPMVLLYDTVLRVCTVTVTSVGEFCGLIPQYSGPGDWFAHLAPFWQSGWYDGKEPGPLWLAVSCVLWVYVYWWFALSRGLRMREARAAYIACAIPAALALVSTLLVNQALIYELLR